jgi:hypothetical protein
MPQNEAAAYGDDELIEIGRQARIELARRAAKRKDILAWGAYIFPEKFNLPFCAELHDYLISIRLDPLTATEAPRGHAKTTIKCFLIPIFQALEEPHLFRHYLSVQATKEKALSINKSIRFELENNRELIDLYGDQVGEQWADGQFVLKNGVIFTAAGTGQSVRGLNYNNIRPDYINVDDLYDDEDIHNPESTVKKNEWVWSTLYPARAKSRRNAMHVQGTAINTEDILAEMKTKPGVTFRSFQTVLDWDKHLLLWPELLSWEGVMAERDVTPETIWNREYQNERTDSASSFIRRQWLYPVGGKSWEYDPGELVFAKDGAQKDGLQLVEILLCIDPSIGEKVENDYTGIALILKARYHDSDAFVYFIHGVWNAHLSLNERVEKVRAIGLTDTGFGKIKRVFVEAIAGFKDFAAELKRRVALAVTMIDHVKDKISNLESKSRHFQNGRVFLNKNIEKGTKDMIVHQLTTNHPKHDDLRDAILLPMEEKTGPTIRVFNNESDGDGE